MAETRVRAHAAVQGSADSTGTQLAAQFNVVKVKRLSLIFPLERVLYSNCFGIII